MTSILSSVPKIRLMAELLKLQFVLHELILSDIGIAVDVLFYFCEELAYTFYIYITVYITSEFLSVLCM
jgi:hypothetical protein